MARYKYKRKKKIDLYTIKQNNATVFELYDEQSLQYVVDMAHGLIYKHGIGAAIPAPAMITNDLNIQKLLCGQKIAYVFVNQDKKTYFIEHPDGDIQIKIGRGEYQYDWIQKQWNGHWYKLNSSLTKIPLIKIPLLTPIITNHNDTWIRLDKKEILLTKIDPINAKNIIQYIGKEEKKS